MMGLNFVNENLKDSFVPKLVLRLLPNQIKPPYMIHMISVLETKEDNASTISWQQNIVITLHAKYTKEGQKGSIDVKVALGFYTSDGFHEIGGGIINILKSNNYVPHPIAFEPSVEVIPAGSKIALILERVDNGSGGVLEIQCGNNLSLGSKSRIELWQLWE